MQFQHANFSVLVAVIGVALFPWRRHRTKMWVGLFALLVSLHLVMKAPVWHLMSRLDLTGGSTGYHRYEVLNAFLEHFSDWYLVGEPDPMSWGVWVMRDVTNMYVAQGLTGGLLTLTIFFLILILLLETSDGHSTPGRLHEAVKRQWVCWCIGVAIFVHAVTFLGVTYFGQMMVMLYLELSLASCVYTFVRRDSLKQRAKHRVVETKRPRRESLGVSNP